MDGGGGVDVNGALFVYRFTQHVENSPQGSGTHGYANGKASINNFHTPHQTIGGAHGNGPNLGVAQELLHLAGDGNVVASGVDAFNFEGIVDLGQGASRKLNV